MRIRYWEYRRVLFRSAQKRLVLQDRDPPGRRGLVMGAAMPALDGMMQDWPLTVDRIIDHAARMFPDIEVVTRRHSGGIVRTGYAALAEEARLQIGRAACRERVCQYG